MNYEEMTDDEVLKKYDAILKLVQERNLNVDDVDKALVERYKQIKRKPEPNVYQQIVDRMRSIQNDSEKLAQIRAHEKINRERLLDQRINRSGLPLRYKDSSFDNYIIREPWSQNMSQVVQVLKDFAKAPKNKIVTLCGKNGAGKTHLEAAVIRALPLQSDYDPFANVQYVSMRKICVALRTSRNFRAEMSEQELYDKYLKIPVLVVDEIGKGDDPVLEKQFFINVIAQRYDEQKAVLAVTNMDSKTFCDWIPGDMKDRYSEIGYIYNLCCDSYRREKRNIQEV